MSETQKPYRLRQGKKHEGYQPGDIVYLTKNQARNFADKFDAADGPERPAVYPTRFATVNDGVRQDFGANTSTSDMVDDDGKQIPPGEVRNAKGVSLDGVPAKIALAPAIIKPGADTLEQATEAPKDVPKPEARTAEDKKKADQEAADLRAAERKEAEERRLAEERRVADERAAAAKKEADEKKAAEKAAAEKK